MIAKHAPSPKNKASSFSDLVKYISDEKGAGEKVGLTSINNCMSDEVDLAVMEVEAVQGMNTRAVSDKTYHLIVSFPTGEIPTKEQLENIEETICDGIGLGEHQRISATHTDTENFHIHIAINKIHPETHNLIDPFYDHYKLSDLCEELEIKHGLEKDNHIGEERNTQETGAKDIEAKKGQQSFQSWCEENVASDVKDYLGTEGASWEGLHSVLAAYDLQIQPNKQNTGMVVGTKSTKEKAVHMAASKLGRNVSKGALIKKLGDFKKAEGRSLAIKPVMKYTAPPLHKSKESNELFSKYKKSNNDTRVTKTKKLKKVREDQLKRRSQLNANAKSQRLKIKEHKGMRPVLKRKAYSDLAANKKIKEKEINLDAQKQRSEIHAEHKILTWPDFLIQEALNENTKALEVLRSRPGGERFKDVDAVEAASEKAQKANENINIFRNLKSNITKDGAVVYSVGDSVIRDEGKKVKLPVRPDEKSIEVALRLSRSKYGKVLDIKGSDEFKKMVVDVAVLEKMDIEFKDDAMEKSRKEGVEIKKSAPSIQRYIDERNSKSSYIYDIMEHRIFEPKDEGKAIYKGQRTMEDGAKIGLFEKNERMLVLPLKEAQAKSLQRSKVGNNVNINVKGQIKSGREI